MNFYIVEFVRTATDRAGMKPFISGKLEGIPAESKKKAGEFVRQQFWDAVKITNIQEMA